MLTLKIIKRNNDLCPAGLRAVSDGVAFEGTIIPPVAVGKKLVAADRNAESA